ncbi:hypothetical protein [Salana multivorans]
MTCGDARITSNLSRDGTSQVSGSICDLIASKKNLCCISAPAPDLTSVEWELRKVGGGYLVQNPDRFVSRRADWKVVTEAQPPGDQWDDMDMVWTVCAYAKSNAVILVKDGVTWDIGAGQQNRRDSGLGWRVKRPRVEPPAACMRVTPSSPSPTASTVSSRPGPPR